jgi:hypothetical protein
MSAVINPIAGSYYIELDGSVNHIQVNNSAWEDWDLSATLPAGTRAADILLSSALTNKGVRQNGSAQVRLGNPYGGQMLAVPDALRIIETYETTGQVFRLLGYWI